MTKQSETIKSAVQRQFDAVAANYSTSPVHALGDDLAHMVVAAEVTGTEQVLDAGCGTGHTALAFAPRVAKVVAVDLTPAMLAQGERLAAERGLTNIHFQPGDVEKLDFPDASFDRVVSRYSAHHWPHPQQALAEFRRVLRPGGLLVLGDVLSWESPELDTFLNAVELLRDTSHVRDHSLSQWLAMLAAAGFAAETIHTWDLFIDFPSWVRRMATPEQHVAMIKTLFDGASADIRTAWQLQEDYSFSFPAGIVRGERTDKVTG